MDSIKTLSIKRITEEGKKDAEDTVTIGNNSPWLRQGKEDECLHQRLEDSA